MPSVYIEYPDAAYRDMFRGQGWVVAEAPTDADLIQFTGGSDVSPSLYGEVNTDSMNDMGRDLREIQLFDWALNRGLPMAGICRGGQFLNVMCGGRMIQDVDGHCENHKAMDHVSGKWVDVTSTHHQMMVRNERGGTLLMSTDDRTGNNKLDNVESLWYARQQVLCFQPHPEYREKGNDMQEVYFDYIRRFLDLAV